MEKEIDRIQKNQDTEIVIRVDDFAGKKGVTIREFVKSERYTGFTKSGLRIPAEKFSLFKKAINSIDEEELTVPVSENNQLREEKKEEKNEKIRKSKNSAKDEEEIEEQEF